MENQIIFTAYTSPEGARMANPVLVNRQLAGLRTVMSRMRGAHVVEEKAMNHLQELAGSVKEVGSKVIFAKKKVGDLRVVSKRMQAVHESLDSTLAQKLNEIQAKS